MPNISVPIEADLKKVFDIPPCESLKIPGPKPLKVTLPTGGKLSGLSDVSKGIPTDCALTFSLMLQIAPLLASMDCLLKILKLLKPLIDVVNGLPVPPVKAVQEFAKAAADLVPCLLVPTPASMIPFVKDLLCLIIRALKCFLSGLKTVIGVMSGATLDLSNALAAGREDEAMVAKCALENANSEAQHLMASVEPIGVILELAGPVFGIAGVEPIKLPSLGSNADLESLNSALQAIQGVVGTLEIAAEALGGCD
jgi:hypothetical protein